MAQKNHVVFGYVDDILGISPSGEAITAYEYLLELLNELNFPVSEKKLVEPTTKCNCLGLNVDTVEQVISIPTDKITDILKKCNEVITHKYTTKRKLQSLIGSIMYVHKCVKSSRFFTNRLLDALRRCNSNFITITKDIKRDVNWFIHFIPKFNGFSKYVKESIPFMHTIAIDACLEGVGGVWGNQVYTAKLPQEWINNKNFHINHFEMINILIAIRLWGTCWKNKLVKFFVDNTSVVQIFSSGYARDTFLATCIRNIWFYTSIWDIALEVQHIPGYKNRTADLLSRWNNSQNNCDKLNSLVSEPVWCEVQASWFHLNETI